MDTPQLSAQQNQALELMLKGENIFLTGEAGSGKSYVIREFMKKKNKKDYPILSSTGMSAVLIGGRTFHSFFGLGIMEGGLEKTVLRALKDKRVIKRLQKAHGIIIDEISMLDGTTLEAAEIITQKARDFELLPWGGLQIIAVGDFLQLPPISKSSRKKWAFQHPIWKYSRLQNVILNENQRTKNSEFLDILSTVREGKTNPPVQKFLDSKIPSTEDAMENMEATYLYPRRFQTDKHNQQKLNGIDSPLITSKSIYLGRDIFIQKLKKAAPVPEEIHLKKDAYIMIRKNDPKGRWVNGSTGILKEIQDGVLVVELLNGRVAEIEKATFSMLDAEGNEVASVVNFPVTLAYATTIHKAQGMTIDRLVVNLKNLWEPGQAYVALSRVRDPNHLFIQDWTPASIKADQQVVDFYNTMNELV
ncbi:MAG: AAA family ATPase [Bdellovibrionaceae bacterium]|nr:AAA family ATPase [Pseudobdellovibrionaceae bacterium]